ncbi:MAG: polyphosphate polymerase domain-containing protein [Oscillospiraceae bacterium]|nr:polyphosphate polymerase domain-containing protein [Oscillospiraceae bacterium]
MKPTAERYRFERKYLLDKDAAYVLSQRVSKILQPDASNPDGLYNISSLYFDDYYNTSFYEKRNGVVERDKFRVRFYNGCLDFLRLERKHKFDAYIYKDSAPVTLEQFEMMCRKEYHFMRESSGKGDVFDKFYTIFTTKGMRPVAMINYQRQAYTYQAGNVRITFDSDLSASTGVKTHSVSILPYNNVILEVKNDRFLPSVITDLLTGIPFTQQLSISKFIMAKMALQGRAI